MVNELHIVVKIFLISILLIAGLQIGSWAENEYFFHRSMYTQVYVDAVVDEAAREYPGILLVKAVNDTEFGIKISKVISVTVDGNQSDTYHNSDKTGTLTMLYGSRMLNVHLQGETPKRLKASSYIKTRARPKILPDFASASFFIPTPFYAIKTGTKPVLKFLPIYMQFRQ
jgi:hypothetical protein